MFENIESSRKIEEPKLKDEELDDEESNDDLMASGKTEIDKEVDPQTSVVRLKKLADEERKNRREDIGRWRDVNK